MTSRMTAGQLRAQATDALCRARALPVGPHRNDLRQIACGLLWLERRQLADDTNPFDSIAKDHDSGRGIPQAR
jgi:hypothetical protein